MPVVLPSAVVPNLLERRALFQRGRRAVASEGTPSFADSRPRASLRVPLSDSGNSEPSELSKCGATPHLLHFDVVVQRARVAESATSLLERRTEVSCGLFCWMRKGAILTVTAGPLQDELFTRAPPHGAATLFA